MKQPVIGQPKQLTMIKVIPALVKPRPLASPQKRDRERERGREGFGTRKEAGVYDESAGLRENGLVAGLPAQNITYSAGLMTVDMKCRKYGAA